MSTVKNSYISLTADPEKKDVQPAGVFYNYDENSAYINFDFDETIDLKEIEEGFVCIRFDTKEKVNDLILSINFEVGSNSGFIIIPKEYMNILGKHAGEVNLRYPDNSITIGHFEIEILKSLIDTQTKNVDDVYIPSFNEILDMYNGLKKQFEDLGLGTFEDAVKAVQNNNGTLTKLYPALKGAVEDGAQESGDKVVADLPYGISVGDPDLVHGLPDGIPKGHDLTYFTFSGEEGRKNVLVFDYYGIWFKNVALNGHSNSKWHKISGEITLWKDSKGKKSNNISIPLNETPAPYSRIKVRCRFLGNEIECFGPSVGTIYLNLTNLHDSENTVYFAENTATLKDGSDQMSFHNVRVKKITSSGGVQDSEGDIEILEVLGVF